MRTIGSPLRSAAHRLEQWGSESLPANLAGGPDLTCARMGRVAPGWPHHPDPPVDTGGGFEVDCGYAIRRSWVRVPAGPWRYRRNRARDSVSEP